MPAALYNDNFNYADENPLSNGGRWIGGYSGLGSLQVVGNEARSDTVALDCMLHYKEIPGDLQWAKGKIATLTGANFGRMSSQIRLTAPTTQTGYDAGPYRNATNSSEISEVTGGSYASLGTNNSATWVSGDTWVFAARGSTLNFYRNGGVPLLSGTDATNSSGRIALLAYAEDALADTEIDDFIGGTLPITLVAAGTEGDAGSGNVTPGTPAGIIAGDILVVICHSSDQVSHSMGTGWTQVVQGNGGGTTSRLSVWWHRYNGVAVPSALITHTAGAGISAGMAAFRGCVRGGDPFDVVGTINGESGASANTIEHNGITIVTDASLILAINGAADDNNRTLLSGWTNVFEDTGAGTNNAFVGTAGTPDESCSMFYIDGFVGATGTVTITQAAADPYASVLVALKPDIQGYRVDPTLQAVKRALFH